MRTPLRSLGLPFNVYYRLHPIFSSCISGLIVILLLYFSLRKNNGNFLILLIQMGLLIVALNDFYFRTHNFQFSIETRAYALWQALWFLIIGLYFYFKRFNALIIILLCLLAATTGASVFQILSFAFSFFLVKLLSKERVGGVIKTIVKVFIIPVGICLYYTSVRDSSYHAENVATFLPQFLEFWLVMKIVAVLSFLSILMTSFSKELRSHTIIFLTMLTLYAISPLINYISTSRGLYFVFRHYRYYDLIYPFFYMSLALALPIYVEVIKKYRTMTRLDFIRLALIACVSIFLFIGYIKSYKEARRVARSQTINRLMPGSYDYLFEGAQDHKKINKKKFKKFVRYYKKITQYHPPMADAHGMLGFSLYYSGKQDQAIAAYKQAIELEPLFFWFYYNLGTIYFKAGQYTEAVKIFKKAMETRPEHALIFIHSSRMIYIPILKERLDSFSALNMQLTKGYQNCYRSLVLSQRYLNRQQPVNNLQNYLNKVNLEVF